MQLMIPVGAACYICFRTINTGVWLNSPLLGDNIDNDEIENLYYMEDFLLHCSDLEREEGMPNDDTLNLSNCSNMYGSRAFGSLDECSFSRTRSTPDSGVVVMRFLACSRRHPQESTMRMRCVWTSLGSSRQ